MSQLPPGGFQWEDSPTRDGRRRWWWIVGVLAVVVLLTGTAALLWHTRGHRLPGITTASQPGPPPIGTPEDRLVGFSLAKPPVPGWKITLAQLGIPNEAYIYSVFATSGDNALVLIRDEPNHCPGECLPRGWVLGVDAATGKVLFNPIELPDYRYGVECYGNGPGAAVCLTYDKPLLAWVIDLDHGKLTYTGPTEIGEYPAGPIESPQAHPVGNWGGESRLVAAVRGKGVYGVGPQAETSWFVPGDVLTISPRMDIKEAAQLPVVPLLSIGGAPLNEHHPAGIRVFSVLDGTDLTPDPAPGTTLTSATTYNGGFAVIATTTEGWNKTNEVLLYDTTGKLLARHPAGVHARLLSNPAMATVLSDDGIDVYTADGNPVTRLPVSALAADVYPVGPWLYVYLGDDYTPWNLHTGQPGAVYQTNAFKIAGTDGTILLADEVESTRAIDIATGQQLWEMPRNSDSGAGEHFLFQVGSHLIQATGPGGDAPRNALTSLVPAS